MIAGGAVTRQLLARGVGARAYFTSRTTRRHRVVETGWDAGESSGDERGNFFALIIYDALQDDEECLIRYAADDPYLLEGEPARAMRTIKQWLKKL